MATTFDGTFDSTFRGATVSSITLSAGTRTLIQAYATKDDYRDSATAAKTITVYSGTVATPVISQTSGQNKFTIACETAEAVIRYTTDGTTPSRTVGSTYSGEVTTTYGLTVKAFAYKELYLDSAAATPVEIVEAGWTTPADITGIESWYEANATDFVVGETNTTWVDKISKGKAFSVANASAPTLSTDKLVFVAANSNILERADDGLSGEGNITVAAVIKFTGTSAADQKVWGCYLGAGKSVEGYMAGNLTVLRMNPAGTVLSVNASDTEVQSGYKLMIWNYISAGTSKADGFKCGAEDADITVSGASGTANFGTYSLFLGRSASAAGKYLNAEIKAIIIVKGTIGVDDLTALKTYCTTNYGADI